MHLFIHHVYTCKYQQHVIIEHCPKVIDIAVMPPSDFRAFRKFLQLHFCPKTPPLFQNDEYRLTDNDVTSNVVL